MVPKAIFARKLMTNANSIYIRHPYFANQLVKTDDIFSFVGAPKRTVSYPNLFKFSLLDYTVRKFIIVDQFGTAFAIYFIKLVSG